MRQVILRQQKRVVQRYKETSLDCAANFYISDAEAVPGISAVTC